MLCNTVKIRLNSIEVEGHFVNCCLLKEAI